MMLGIYKTVAILITKKSQLDFAAVLLYTGIVIRTGINVME